jgi:hypothetical protein
MMATPGGAMGEEAERAGGGRFSRRQAEGTIPLAWAEWRAPVAAKFDEWRREANLMQEDLAVLLSDPPARDRPKGVSTRWVSSLLSGTLDRAPTARELLAIAHFTGHLLDPFVADLLGNLFLVDIIWRLRNDSFAHAYESVWRLEDEVGRQELPCEMFERAIEALS